MAILSTLFTLLAVLLLLAAIAERRTGWLSAWRRPHAPVLDESPIDRDGRGGSASPAATPGRPLPPDKGAAIPDPERPFDPLREAAQRARQRLYR